MYLFYFAYERNLYFFQNQMELQYLMQKIGHYHVSSFKSHHKRYIIASLVK